MIKENKYMVINYTNKDLEYIDYLCTQLEINSFRIVNFFNLHNFGEKIIININDDLNFFRNKIKKIRKKECEEWLCGLSYNKIFIETLCLEEYRKTKSHNKVDINDMLLLILHEFVHSCCNKINDKMKVAWLSEGLATTLSGQYDNIDNKFFDATKDEMINGTSKYYNYYLMFKYVIDNYGKDYILCLISNIEILNKETPKLYEEAKKYYKTKSR